MSGLRLQGVALVTGAGSGIGRETAYAFAEAGAAGVVFADVNVESAQAASTASKKFATSSDYRGVAVKVDALSLASVRDMVEETMKHFGRIDYCVNSAGVDTKVYAPITEASVEDYDHVVNINARGTYYVMREVLKVMQGQETRTVAGRNGKRDVGRGSIVNVGSSLSFAAVPGKIGYIASKHALLGVTKSAAVENSSLGIRVNAVLPSWSDTAMFEDELKKVPQTLDFIKAAVPAKRPALPEEVAETVLFLCSPSASYISGIGMPVDAGLTITVHPS